MSQQPESHSNGKQICLLACLVISNLLFSIRSKSRLAEKLNRGFPIIFTLVIIKLSLVSPVQTAQEKPLKGFSTEEQTPRPVLHQIHRN